MEVIKKNLDTLNVVIVIKATLEEAELLESALYMSLNSPDLTCKEQIIIQELYVNI